MMKPQRDRKHSPAVLWSTEEAERPANHKLEFRFKREVKALLILQEIPPVRFLFPKQHVVRIPEHVTVTKATRI